MKQFPPYLLVSIAILCVLATHCGQPNKSTTLQSRFKEITLPFEIKFDELSSLEVKDTIDNGPFLEAVHVLGWLQANKEVIALYYLTKNKDCIAAKIRTYKDGDVVEDQKISDVICSPEDCGTVYDQRLTVSDGGQFENRSERQYLPCDSSEIIPDDLKAKHLHILSGHIDLEGRVLTKTKTTMR